MQGTDVANGGSFFGHVTYASFQREFITSCFRRGVVNDPEITPLARSQTRVAVFEQGRAPPRPISRVT